MSKKVTGVTGWSEKMGILAGGGKVSIENPFNPMWGWKVDPDNRQDRSDGPVIVRKMTEEEKIKYGIAVEGEEKKMRRPKINYDEAKILEICRELGTGNAGCKEIAKTYNCAEKTAANIIYRCGIRQKLKEEAASIKEIAEQVGKQVARAAQESTEKIKLRNAVDEMMEMVPDSVNHPVHYTVGKIEVIDYLQEKMTAEMFEGFCIGNALKYLSRYRFKGGLEDLKKAEWYLDRIIKAIESA